jgi:hypothetical protein
MGAPRSNYKPADLGARHHASLRTFYAAVRIALCLFCVLGAVRISHSQASQTANADVEIEGWNAEGHQVEALSLELTPVRGGQRYSASGKAHSISIHVPLGAYFLRVKSDGYRDIYQYLVVGSSKIFQTVMLSSDINDWADKAPLNGTITNYDGDVKALRVRLVGLYGNDFIESRVDSKGSFIFAIREGIYQLVTLADSNSEIRVLDVRGIAVHGLRKIVIDLKGKTPQVIPSWP